MKSHVILYLWATTCIYSICNFVEFFCSFWKAYYYILKFLELFCMSLSFNSYFPFIVFLYTKLFPDFFLSVLLSKFYIYKHNCIYQEFIIVHKFSFSLHSVHGYGYVFLEFVPNSLYGSSYFLRSFSVE